MDRVGFHADHDYQVTGTLRFVKLDAPGSACSIATGTGITFTPPEKKTLKASKSSWRMSRRRGGNCSTLGAQASEVDVQPWGWFSHFFSDPDGYTWALQQLPPRS